MCRVHPREGPLSVGRTIASARQESGLSLVDVSEATKIRMGVLQAIERDDFSGCGGDVYARGQLRSIGRVVGLDGDELVAAYTVQTGLAEEIAAEPDVQRIVEVTAKPERRRRPRSFNWSVAMGLALVVVIGIGGYSLLQSRTGGSAAPAESSQSATPSSPAPDEPSADASSPAPAPTSSSSTPQPSPSSSDVLAQADRVLLTIDVSGSRSWVSVSAADGSVLYEGLMKTGDSMTFDEGQAISLVLGNAGAVELTVNGAPLDIQAAEGEVRRFDFEPGATTSAAA